MKEERKGEGARTRLLCRVGEMLHFIFNELMRGGKVKESRLKAVRRSEVVGGLHGL